MKDQPWEIQVNNFEARFTSSVYIYRIVGDYIEWLEIKSPDMIGHREKFERMGGAMPENMKPTFECMTNEVVNITKAFLIYANAQGFKNGTETFNKGKLEATERHLEDMRSLVFKKE